jgi:hypothetical protein
MQTVSITDYTLLTPKLAKVVIAYTGKFNKESLRGNTVLKNRMVSRSNQWPPFFSA